MNGKRILIVEDEQLIGLALGRFLSLPGSGGYRVEVCNSAEEALTRLEANQFDLLISDFRLPGMDGLELLEHVRQSDPDTRGILITAFGSAQVEEQAHLLANAYILKPFRLREVIQVVQQVLDDPGLPGQSHFGPACCQSPGGVY